MGAPEPVGASIIGWCAGAEFYLPTKEDRPIRTINANVSAHVTIINDLRLSLHGGLTATYAWGTIRQTVGQSRDSTLASTAAGIGPFLGLRWAPFTIGPVVFQLSVDERFLLYGTRFPAGGDIYNFMFRAGPDIAIPTGSRTALMAGYRWMHVSNGQGLGAFNPSYEGSGMRISMMGWF